MSSAAQEAAALARLLSRAGEGDAGAFAVLYERTSGRLFGLVLRLLRDREEAEEVLQEVFVTVWRRARDFDAARASAGTWLVTIARNRAIDRLRQHRPRHDGEAIDLEALADEGEEPPAAAETSEAYQRLHRCLEALDPKSRRAVREAFFTGATYKELAQRCQVPLGTLKSWIRRALAQLRTCLEG